MKLVPNMFLVCVADVAKAQAFYESIFEIEAAFSMPTFAAYPLGGGVMFALQNGWSAQPEGTRPNSELVMNISAPTEEFDELYQSWLAMGAIAVDPPQMAPFGYTFVVADPDGNLIRVAPQDE